MKVIADVEGLEETQVAWVARHLRQGGLLAQGGRGKGGAQMSVADAVNLLVAVNAGGAAPDAPATVGAFRALRLTEDTSDTHGSWDGSAGVAHAPDEFWDDMMSKGSLLGDALERLVHASTPWGSAPAALLQNRSGPERMSLLIEFARPVPIVLISGEDAPGQGEMFDGEEVRRPLIHARFTGPGSSTRPGDRKDRTTITSRTLLAVGQALAT